jgi:predicted ferric reductase
MATFELPAAVAQRHIQNFSDASSLEQHWGYVSRAIPCANDAGSCAYLDLVYSSHDRGMLYSGILWSTIAGIVFLWAMGRRIWPSQRADEVVDVDGQMTSLGPGGASRLRRTIATGARSYLLPESVRSVFGRTTRLQVLVLAILSGYLLIWSFVGITYQTWLTPVKSSPGLYNIRTSIGPWSDRIGILAYALTPLSIMLSSRESILSLATGIPYQSFNFLHRWLGYIIVVQGALHTISWTVVEVRLYQPQPTTAIEWVTQTYIVWGIVAMILLLLMFVLSTPWGIRATGYEFFRKAHYVLAMVYIGACWGHWYQLHCFLLPSLILWFLDRGIRLARTAMIHHQYLPSGSMTFKAAQATVTHFADAEHGDLVRLDFAHNHEAWKVGQHFYLCFPESSIWQSHPFTPLNMPEVKNGAISHAYIIRAKKGETKKIADLALKKMSEKHDATTSVILSGHYGDAITESLTPDVNVLCVAGGTGIAYVLPVMLSLIQQPYSKDRRIELVWAVRRKEDIRWIEQEMNLLRQAAKTHGVVVYVFVTREHSPTPSLKDGKLGGAVKEVGSSATSDSSSDQDSAYEVRRIGGESQPMHPDLKETVTGFVENTVRGRTMVYASGPGGMISDLRSVIASCNSPSKVWSGNERYDVSLTCDDRLEW